MNHAYAVILSAQFQGFCRDLYAECVEALVDEVRNESYQNLYRAALLQNLKLGHGNPNPGNIGSDFNRLGIAFWYDVKRLGGRNEDRLAKLEALNLWRNAIAHQDFDPAKLGTAALRLARVQSWRSACKGLTVGLDEAMRGYIESVGGDSPW